MPWKAKFHKEMLKLNKTKMAVTKDWGKLVHTKVSISICVKLSSVNN